MEAKQLLESGDRIFLDELEDFMETKEKIEAKRTFLILPSNRGALKGNGSNEKHSPPLRGLGAVPLSRPEGLGEEETVQAARTNRLPKKVPVRRSALIAIMLALGALVVSVPSTLVPTAQAAPESVPVTVTIMRVTQVEDPDLGGEAECTGAEFFSEFYATVQISDAIDVKGKADSCLSVQSSRDWYPHWMFTRFVSQSLGEIPIRIQIWDQDFVPGDDDIIDINPNDGMQELEISLDLETGAWSGDVVSKLGSMGFSEGDGDTEHFPQFPSPIPAGGYQAKILFDISLISNGDTDFDGLPDAVERFGVLDGNGILAANFGSVDEDGDGMVDIDGDGIDDDFGGPADPCRKTVAVEIDYMTGAPDGHTHQPLSSMINTALGAFNGAPVPAVSDTECPYEGFPTQAAGVQLILDIDDQLPEQQAIDFDDDFGAIKSSVFDPSLKGYVHYNVWAHNQAGTTSSGIAEVGGNDLIVSLGSFGQVGTERQQVGTFMHELGHNLGLKHGGDQSINCKPNYLSVMSYTFQLNGIGDPVVINPAATITDASGNTFRFDYSRRALPDLNEFELDENAGIGDDTDITIWDVDGSGPFRASAPGNGPIDWDGDNMVESLVAADITNLGISECGPSFNPDAPSLSLLRGFNDWANLQYNFWSHATLSDGVHTGVHEEITAEDAEIVERAWQHSLSPDLKVSKSVDLADAIPGDTLTYTVTVENVGTGDATAIELVDVLPDGTTTALAVEDLQPGESATSTFGFVVPFPVADMSVHANTATVTGRNLLGRPDINPDNNVAVVLVVVHTPVITVEKTATEIVNAGDSVLYRISYENTGSADALVAVVSDTLPAEVSYSSALDTGSGPAPDSVLSNSDGTTTLRWEVGTLPAASGVRVVEYTARPSLLLLAEESVANHVSIEFSDANGNDYPAEGMSVITTITEATVTGAIHSVGWWSNHPEAVTDEVLARIQATDQRYDLNTDGALGLDEGIAALKGAKPQNLVSYLRGQLLATYLNLASRAYNAGTPFPESLTQRISQVGLDLDNAREVVQFAQEILGLALDRTTVRQYIEAISVLEVINTQWVTSAA